MLPALIAAGAALAGGALSRRSAESAGNKNADLQRDFAKNSIQWRVADAKKAGLSPLAALGNPGIAASPAYVGGGDYGLSDFGQDISRAMYATKSSEDRGDALGSFIEQKVAAQDARDTQKRHESREDLRLQSQLANDEVQRQWYNAQIAKLQADVSKPIPTGASRVSSGSSARGGVSGPRTGGVEYKPDEVISADPKRPYATAGTHPAFSRFASPFGFDIYAPGQSFSESLEGAGEIGGLVLGTIPSLGLTGWEALKAIAPKPTTRYRQYPTPSTTGSYWRSPWQK